MVIGTTFLTALVEAENVTVTAPLIRLFELSFALTPAGRPEIASVTVPYPNEFTRSLAVPFPAGMLYDPRSSPNEKSAKIGFGAVHAATGEVVGCAQVEL